MEQLEPSSTEAVNKSDILNLASWNRTRSTEELLSFISRRESQIFAE